MKKSGSRWAIAILFISFLIMSGCKSEPLPPDRLNETTADSSVSQTGRSEEEDTMVTTSAASAGKEKPTTRPTAAKPTVAKPTVKPLQDGKAAALKTVNVKDFGAVGDGKTKDTAAFQKAIDAVAAKGGYVYIPSGVYCLNAVRVKSNVCLYSDLTWDGSDKESCGKTVLIPESGSVSCVVNMAGEEHIKNPALMNVCIDGRGMGSSLAGVASLGKTAVEGTSMRIENVRVMDCTGVGIDAANNAIVSIRGCFVTGCETGIKLVGWDLFINGNTIAGNRGDGLYLTGGTAANLCYNKLAWNDKCGIHFDGFGRVTMMGNTFDSNACPGVYFNGSANMALHNNMFIRNGWAPKAGMTNANAHVSVNASSGINITDNTFKGADSFDVLAPEYGIIGDVMHTSIIQGNVFRNAFTKEAIHTNPSLNTGCIIENP